MRWRKYVAVCALCCAGSAAQAADQSVPQVARGQYEYFPGAVYWTGFYVGLNLGGAFGSAPWTDHHDGLTDDPIGFGVIGGGQFGANWQHDAWVLGFETDFDGQDVRGSVVDAAGDKHVIRSSWLSTVTGRAGYAFGQTLLFVKGGVGFADERNELTTAPLGLTANTSTSTQVGWTVGGGLEYGFTHSWSGKLEYDFVDLPSHLTVQGPALGSPVFVNFTIQRLIAGINYHF